METAHNLYVAALPDYVYRRPEQTVLSQLVQNDAETLYSQVELATGRDLSIDVGTATIDYPIFDLRSLPSVVIVFIYSAVAA